MSSSSAQVSLADFGPASHTHIDVGVKVALDEILQVAKFREQKKMNEFTTLH